MACLHECFSSLVLQVEVGHKCLVCGCVYVCGSICEREERERERETVRERESVREREGDCE